MVQRLADLDTDALLVTAVPNVRYLTGFTGSNAQLLLGRDDARFFTDGRYAEQSSHEVAGVAAVIYADGFPERFAAACRDLGVSRVAFEADSVTYQQHADLQRPELELLPTRGAVEALRWVKDPEEVSALNAAQGIADRVFDSILGELAEGLTEREVGFRLDTAMLQAGADALAFETIVAFGPNAAEPHHHPGDRTLARGDVVKLDFGAQCGGYHSDMTRTVAFGEPSDRLREVYQVVLRAQLAGIAAVRAGVSGGDADEASRAVIRDAGYADAYKHSLGHGVGLQIHEGPSLRREGTDVLPAGAVVTVEPGIYLEGVGGVRIEDMVEVTTQGCRTIPQAPKELIVL
jgi:Xaa-Pro aminopeptidase